MSVGQGEIVYAGFRGGGYGNMVALKRTDEHAGDIIAYKHIRNTYPRPLGSQVKSNDVVGYMSGTGSSAVYRQGQKGNYAIHLHMEYLAKPSAAVQYEIHGKSMKIYDGFKTLGHKGTTDSHLRSRGHNLLYTDPSPYFCDPIEYENNRGNQSLGGYRYQFKNSMEQYRFVMTKLGKQPGINAGNPPTAGEYSAAQAQIDAEIACAANADVLATNAAAGVSVAAEHAAAEAASGTHK